MLTNRAERSTWLAVLLLLVYPVSAQDNPAVDPPPETAARQPADDLQYETYRALYDYDARAPLEAEVARSFDDAGTIVEEIRFDSVNGERVPGYLLLPPSEARLPVILALHGYGGSSAEILPLASVLATYNVQIAVLSIDAQYHGQRRQEGLDLLNGDFELLRGAFVQTVIDYRRAIDLLVDRPEIDPERIGVVGVSLGAMMGCVLAAVEPRVKTAVLAVGGADWVQLLRSSDLAAARDLREARPEVDWEAVRLAVDPVDPLHFAPHLGQRPVLLINGREDTIVPPSCGQLLQDVAAGDPLVAEWYDSGHQLPPETVLDRVFTWLQEYL